MAPPPLWRIGTAGFGLLILLGAGCTNNPYREGETAEDTLFFPVNSEPTKLDPVAAYYSHEGEIIDQIYEPPFTYHYLKRPYEVIPLTAEAVPNPVYFDPAGELMADLDPPATEVGRAEYTIRIRRGVYYQNHPCFARDEAGELIYQDVSYDEIKAYDYPSKFPHQGTREATASDYALQIRRMADPRHVCPIYSTLDRYIEGFGELSQIYTDMLEEERSRRKDAAGANYNREQDEAANPIALDYFAADFPGCQVLDEFTYKLVLKRKYPQIRYWLCMHFFGPMAQEAIDFFRQPAMIRKHFSITRCPVGTGAYYLETYRPNEWIEFRANPNYHEDFYPSEGMPEDEESGLLADAGERLPFIKRQVFVMEKEAIPSWNKFIQGYYDLSKITVDVFDQAVDLQPGADAEVSGHMMERGITLETAVETWFWYMEFNQMDEVLGPQEGDSEEVKEKKRKLRLAISIAQDSDEYKEIFLNGRGWVAHSPVPPGIFGFRHGREGMNPYVFDWDESRERPALKSIEAARQLMVEAGYPGGRGPDGQPLIIYYDHASITTSFRSIFEWNKERFALLGIRLKERQWDLSRLRQKFDQGDWQLTTGGWIADYPDPENFLFLFYGPNSKARFKGSNNINYASPAFDAVFAELESMENSPRRQELIDEALEILRRDAPAAWQYFPESYTLLHSWLKNFKPHQMSKNVMKYRRIDGAHRAEQQEAWNQPVVWPVLLLLGLVIATLVPGAVSIYRRERGR